MLKGIIALNRLIKEEFIRMIIINTNNFLNKIFCKTKIKIKII